MQAAELRLYPPDGAFPGVDKEFAETPDITRKSILNLEWLENGELTALFHLEAPNEQVIAEILETNEGVHDHDIIEIEEESFHTYVSLEHTQFVDQLLSIVDNYSLILHRPIRLDGDSVVATVAGNETAASEAFADLQDTVDISVEWTGKYTPLQSTPLAQLTDRQREALETAYDVGFYETPREASYEELAEELDCAPSTANALLHRSEAALIEAVLDTG